MTFLAVFSLWAIFMAGKLLALRSPEAPGGALSDQSLVAACALGDRAALGLLFDRYHAVLYRFLARMAGADADDLVQATFLEVLRASPRYQGKAPVRTWLFSIAANVARHHIRSEGRRRAFRDRFDERPPEPGPCPDAATERKQLFERLAQALEALPYELRSAFVLCDLGELSGAEAAAALGVPEGTLWRRLSDARSRLRAALAERRPEP